MKRAWAMALLAAMSMSSATGWAQTDAKSAEKALKGQVLGLRGYSAESVAKVKWDGERARTGESCMRTGSG